MKKKYLYIILFAFIILLSFKIINKTDTSIQSVSEKITVLSEDNIEIRFGDLRIDLPEGWTFENRIDESGEIKSYLIDNHKHSEYYNHEIFFRRYKISDKLTGTALLYELTKLADSNDIRSCDYKKEGDYCILIALDDYSMEKKWFIRNGQDLYITEEFSDVIYSEQEEEFYDFLKKRRVSIQDLENIVNTPEEYGSHTMFYKILNVNEEISFFAVLNKSEENSIITLYQPEKWDMFFTQITGDERIPYYWKINDINNDGYMDLQFDVYGRYEGYIWDNKKNEFQYYSKNREESNVNSNEEIESLNKIPKGLLEEIEQAMKNGTEREKLSSMINDRELSVDEIITLEKNNPDLAIEVNKFAATDRGEGLFIMSDGDNDGIDDILLQSYLGGSGGFTYFYFFKGLGEGLYKRTSMFDSVRQEFGFIQYEGKNYLCCTNYDYGKKIHNGFSIYCYEDGKPVEEVILERQAEEFVSEIYFTESNDYIKMAEEIQNNSIKYKEDSNIMTVGTGELKKEIERDIFFESDINNDGKIEAYHKSIWYTTNMYTIDTFSFSMIAESEEDIEQIFSQIIQEKESYPLMMWVDNINNKNIVNIKFNQGLFDYSIDSYLLLENSYKKVSQVNFSAIEFVAYHIYNPIYVR